MSLVESGCCDKGTVEAAQNESVPEVYDKCASVRNLCIDGFPTRVRPVGESHRVFHRVFHRVISLLFSVAHSPPSHVKRVQRGCAVAGRLHRDI